MRQYTEKEMEEVLGQYSYLGELKEAGAYGNGHINRTYLLKYEKADGGMRRVILQGINREVFQNPEELMENVVSVTEYLREKIVKKGGDPDRETLSVFPTGDGMYYYVDSQENYWRAYAFIEGASCYDQPKSQEDFYQSALAFGNFQYLLSDFPAEMLHETIPQFHDTGKRLNDFKEAVQKDVCGRAAQVQDEIAFVLERESDAKVFGEMLAKQELPLRVTHNDTKLNNIMIDNETRKGICVIDLDTVMPGLAAYDYGDSIRFGANTAAEDETDLTKVSCDLELFRVYTRGFLEGCRGALTKREVETLPLGAKVMTYECGMRFLTDYLEGDHYFKISREGQNLDRARTQFKMVEDMEKKWKQMAEIVEEEEKRWS